MILLAYRPHGPTSREAQEEHLAQLTEHLAKLTEASYALLELIYPRHVIEFMSDGLGAGQEFSREELLPYGTDLRCLTTSHQEVRPRG